jgi:hypothetical protein
MTRSTSLTVIFTPLTEAATSSLPLVPPAPLSLPHEIAKRDTTTMKNGNKIFCTVNSLLKKGLAFRLQAVGLSLS